MFSTILLKNNQKKKAEDSSESSTDKKSVDTLSTEPASLPSAIPTTTPTSGDATTKENPDSDEVKPTTVNDLDSKPDQEAMDTTTATVTPHNGAAEDSLVTELATAEDSNANKHAASQVKEEEKVSKAEVEEEKMDLDAVKAETLDVKKEEDEEEGEEDEEDEEEEEEEEEEVSEYEEDGGEIEVEEFFVKYKTFSYLHCEWRTRDELFYSDKRVDQKIKRYKLKKAQQQQCAYDLDELNEQGYAQDDDELFNPDYVEVDRILDVYDMDDPAKPGAKLKYFLVKWKTLPYDEASWELEKDIKNAKKIEAFYTFNTLVADVHQRVVAKPRGDKWQQIPATREYKNNMRLREYQLEGINWLTFCWLNARNCILADEMGLGKTVQSVTFLQEVGRFKSNCLVCLFAMDE